MVPIDGSGLHPDDHIGELQCFHCRHDLFCQQFSTAKIVLHGKATIFGSIRFHQVRNVVLSAHINANEKLVHEYHLPVWWISGQQALRYP